MRSFANILFIVCCLVLVHSKLNHKPLRIINGSTVDPPHSLPYQVLLILGSDPVYDVRFCGGALISEEWVLTSGNCIYNSDVSICEAYLGSQNISKEEDELQFSFVVDYIIHEDFDPEYLAYNIGLVQLQTPAVFNDSVQAINLIPQNQTKASLVGKSGIISGWGSNNVSDIEKIVFVLQSATTTIVSDDSCTQSDSYLDLSTHMCAKSENNAHIYGTDFGGPLVVNGTLVGISSVWSGNETDLDLYTNVHEFLNWISEITGIPVN